MAYGFIQNHYKIFGVRWLLSRLNICPNAYYNYLKDRKKNYRQTKEIAINAINTIYHEHNGIDGYRSMKVYLERKKINLSKLTVHKYMNVELKLCSIVRRKKPRYERGYQHKVFSNLINQDFSASKINQKWCTDFTYLFLANGSKRYNCSIMDLYDRSIIASITDKSITSDLAICTLQKALGTQPSVNKLILHSDQGSQFTSREFTAFCVEAGIKQSMSKVGYPYDNAPIKRYYNTLKNELINYHYYHTDEELNKAVDNFAYIHYNHVRPHAYNNYKTPFELRYAK